MEKKNSKNREFKNFTDLALEWWNPNGKFKILHQILPLRMEYILKNIDKSNLKNLDILDLGCGGGLTCESLARLDVSVTGIDFVKENITTAKKHALKSDLKINYLHEDINKIILKKKYDTILLLEVLEHLDEWELLIKKIKKNLKPQGKIIISTINKNKISNFFGIYVAENILKWVPKNTHEYNKLITPDNLKKNLKKNNLVLKNIEGMNYNPFLNQWSLSKKIYPINYFCTAQLI